MKNLTLYLNYRDPEDQIVVADIRSKLVSMGFKVTGRDEDEFLVPEGRRDEVEKFVSSMNEASGASVECDWFDASNPLDRG